MYSSAIAKLEQRVEKLEEKIDKQAEEINNLKAILNNICASIREDKEKLNSLMFQNDNKFERSNILTKEELYNQMKVTQINPVEAEYYRQINKAIKEEKRRSDPREYLDCYNEHDRG